MQKFSTIGISEEKMDSWGKIKTKDNWSGRLGLMSALFQLLQTCRQLQIFTTPNLGNGVLNWNHWEQFCVPVLAALHSFKTAARKLP